MPKGYFIPFTAKQEQQLKDEYLCKPVKRLAVELNASYGRIMRFLDKNGLKIPPELKEKRQLDSRKKKGCVPFNKGMRQSEYMTEESIIKSRKYIFKKYNKPHNTSHDGAIRIRKDKSGRLYKFIRIRKSVWVEYHRYIWEKHNGEIKNGKIISFKDGDTLNCDITNLEIISRIENMYRNSKHNYPKEIIPSLVLSKKLETKIKEIEDGK